MHRLCLWSADLNLLQPRFEVSFYMGPHGMINILMGENPNQT